MAEENDEGKKSVFNAGVAQAERIDALQRAINYARFNILMPNPDTGTYNYQIIIDSLNGLAMEVWSKASVKEQKIINRVSNLTMMFVSANPPVKKVIKNGEEAEEIDDDNLTKLRMILTLYERVIRDALDEHNLNSPNKDWDDDDDF